MENSHIMACSRYAALLNRNCQKANDEAAKHFLWSLYFSLDEFSWAGLCLKTKIFFDMAALRMNCLLQLFAICVYQLAETSKAPVIQSLNVTVNSVTTNFRVVNGTMSQQIIDLQSAGRVQIAVQASDADQIGSSSGTGNIVYILDSTLGSLLAESSDVFNGLLSDPQYLKTSSCSLNAGSLCQTRAAFLCREIVANVLTLTDSGCSMWPSSLNHTFISSIANVTVNGRQQQNVSTFRSEFTYNVSSVLMNNLTSIPLINVSNPYRQVCVQAVSPSDQQGAFDRSAQLCIIFRFPTAPSAPLDCGNILPGFSLLLDPSTFPLTACGARSILSSANPSIPQPPSCGLESGIWCQWPIVVAVGQSVRAKVYFKSNAVAADSTQSAFQIGLLSNPGLPSGAAVSATRLEYVALYSGDPSSAFLFPVYSREVTFIATVDDLRTFSSDSDPLALTASIDYPICFAGQDSATAAAAAARPPSPVCGTIRVARPEPRVVVALSDFPLGAACVASGACDERFGMGTEVFQCGSAFVKRQSPLDGPVTCAPAADAYDFRVRCTYTWTLYLYDARTRTEMLSGLDPDRYVPTLSEDPAEPLPPGAALSEAVTELRNFSVVGEDLPRRLTRQVKAGCPRAHACTDVRVGPSGVGWCVEMLGVFLACGRLGTFKVS